jgi:membrane protein implicated in regulation of membrane protease activity
MFFIWGSYGKQRLRGFVADRCPLCRCVRTFQVTDQYHVNHIYYIPLGRGELLSTTKTCETCGAQVPWNEAAHPEVVRTIQGSSADLLRTTNPLLDEFIEAERDVEGRRSTAETSHDPEGHWNVICDGVALDLVKLRGRGYDTDDFAARLKCWPDLSDGDRSRLRAGVEEARTTFDKVEAASAFLRRMSRSVPDNPGCATGFLTWIALALGTLPLWTILWNGWIVALNLVALIVGFAVFLRVGSWRLRRWFERTLIPESRALSIDLAVLVGVFASVRRDTKNPDEKLKALLGGEKALIELLIEKGLIVRTGSPATEHR